MKSFIKVYTDKIIKNPEIHNSTQQFTELKKELLRRVIAAEENDFDISSVEAKRLYENHVLRFDIDLEFNNVGLCAFAAFNMFNSQAPANQNLWKGAIEFVASHSKCIHSEKGILAELKIDQSRPLLIKFMKEGGRLCDSEKANNNAYDNLKRNNKKSIPIKALRTISELTRMVSKYEDPTIGGLCDHLIGLAQQEIDLGEQDIWSKALIEMKQIHGHGTAISGNFIKDLLLWRWNVKNKSFESLKIHPTGQTTKPDIHLKRMICLMLQPWMLKALKNSQLSYENFSESATEKILNISAGESDSWESYYFKIVNKISNEAKITPLELDRTIYGLMSGNVAGEEKDIVIESPKLIDLEKLLLKDEEAGERLSHLN